MTELKIRVLGDLEVIRGGDVLNLPPSKKTRGLLAYLALNQRSFRREQLCELLWEIPDDPRGSLRWSLSKIRKLVDHEQQPRIIANRTNVSFDASNVDIDACSLHALAEGKLDDMGTDAIQQAADTYQGGFLEGLDLPNFHDFYTWCIGQREHVLRSQTTLLKALLLRLGHQPEQALDYSNRLVSLLPYDEAARVSLIQLLVQLDRMQEAEQQYRMGLRLLEELGVEDSGILYRAWRGTPGAAAKKPGATESGIDTAEVKRKPAKAFGAAPSMDKTLVGRDRELEILTALFNEVAETGVARVLLIRGDPGIGKSRLLHAAAALAREHRAGILKADAFESELIRPFAVWNDALRRSLPGNSTSALLGSGERITRDQVFASLSDLMCEQTEKRPAVVLFDDVQWCDESSAGALHHVLRINPRRPILIVAAARETELRDNAAVQQVIRGLRHDNLLQEMKLEPLSASAIHELIVNQAPQVDAGKLSKECAGNPLLAIELARAEAEGDTGSSLKELFRERMSRLDEDAVAVLLWAAVLAPRINIKYLEQITGLERDRIDASVEAAEQQGILHPGERGLRFSHDLIAKAVYAEISPARLQMMHRRAAELLEVDAALDLELAADLAHHAPKSGDPALAAKAMVFAGRLCLRFYANEDALALYQRGLDFATQLGTADRVCRTLELCDVRLSAAPLEDWETAAKEYIDLAEQALDHGALPHARLGYQMASYVRWAHGQWSDARRNSLQAERVTRTGTDEQQIIGMAEAAKCLALLERDLSQADALVMEARSLAERNRINCAAIPVCLGILRYYENQVDDAVEHLEDARTICKAQGDRLSEYMVNEYLTMIEIERGDYAAAKIHCNTLIDIGTRIREGSERPFAVALDALCQYGLDAEDPGLDAVMEELRVADAKQRLAYVLNRAAILDLRHQRQEIALARATEALQIAQLMERPSEILQAHITLATVQRNLNQDAEAEHIKAARELAAGPVARWARERAEQILNS